jgi:lipopolysaccharide/colanic/teichoic acid biosynthesis glycosyltransferase
MATGRSADRQETRWLTGPASYAVGKRALDVAASAIALVVFAPLMAVIAGVIALESRGPILFTQERLGRGGVPFLMFKFRSMRVAPIGSGPLVTAAGDRRVTSVGRFLRRHKLDELPQLANVIRGEMSLVGPRPEVARHARAYPVEYQRVLSVRPGMVDYATLEFRDEEELLARSSDPEVAYIQDVLPAKIRLYFRYIEDMSMKTDVVLIARTVRALVGRA